MPLALPSSLMTYRPSWIEIAPWLHVTPDVQVIIDPGGSSDNDTATILGLRMKMKL